MYYFLPKDNWNESRNACLIDCSQPICGKGKLPGKTYPAQTMSVLSDENFGRQKFRAMKVIKGKGINPFSNNNNFSDSNQDPDVNFFLDNIPSLNIEYFLPSDVEIGFSKFESPDRIQYYTST